VRCLTSSGKRGTVLSPGISMKLMFMCPVKMFFKITSAVLRTRMFFDIELRKSDTVHFKENFHRLFHCCESWQCIYTYRLVLEPYRSGGAYTRPGVRFNIYFLSRWYGRNGSTWLLNSEGILFLLCGLWSLFQWLLLGYW